MTELRVMCDLLLGQHSGFSLTLAGQTVVADDGDAEALSFHLGESNLMDLVSFEIGLKPNTHTHTPTQLTCFGSESSCACSSDPHELTGLLTRRWGGFWGGSSGVWGGKEETGADIGGGGGGGAAAC